MSHTTRNLQTDNQVQTQSKMSYAPVFDYLFATAKPKPYAIFRAFIIAHDSQDLERFQLWVDRLLEDYVPLLNKPAFIKNHFIRALTEAKTVCITSLLYVHYCRS